MHAAYREPVSRTQMDSKIRTLFRESTFNAAFIFSKQQTYFTLSKKL